MKKDTLINLTIISTIALTLLLLLQITKFNSRLKIEKFSTVITDLNQLSHKIKDFYQNYQRLPESLDEEKFKEYINNISFIDPYCNCKFKYKITENGWIIYSIGPNNIDDGGVMEEGKVLDIVVIGKT